jgi:hypothetical protein
MSLWLIRRSKGGWIMTTTAQLLYVGQIRESLRLSSRPRSFYLATCWDLVITHTLTHLYICVCVCVCVCVKLFGHFVFCNCAFQHYPILVFPEDKFFCVAGNFRNMRRAQARHQSSRTSTAYSFHGRSCIFSKCALCLFSLFIGFDVHLLQTCMNFLWRDHTSGVTQCHCLHGRVSWEINKSPLSQRCTNPERQVVRVTEFYAVTPNTCWFSVWTCLMSTVWSLEFWGSSWMFGEFVDHWLD